MANKLIKTGIILFIGLAISGCTTTSGALPKCNGYSKRALNKSMWDWQNKAPQAMPTIVNNFITENKTDNQFNSVLSKNLRMQEMQSYKECE